MLLEVEESCELEDQQQEGLQEEGEHDVDPSQGPQGPPLHQLGVGPRVPHCEGSHDIMC